MFRIPDSAPRPTTRAGCTRTFDTACLEQWRAPVDRVLLHSKFDSLNKFHSISKWIAKFKALEARYGNRIRDRRTRLLQTIPPLDDVRHLIRHVRLGRRAVRARFDADMHLQIAHR